MDNFFVFNLCIAGKFYSGQMTISLEYTLTLRQIGHVWASISKAHGFVIYCKSFSASGVMLHSRQLRSLNAGQAPLVGIFIHC